MLMSLTVYVNVKGLLLRIMSQIGLCLHAWNSLADVATRPTILLPDIYHMEEKDTQTPVAIVD
jgi:hypothetical protein